MALVLGASRGIGAQIARTLADRGAMVVAAARTERDLHALAEEITNNGGHCLVAVTDASTPSSISQLMERTFDTYERPDVAVNNAATNHPPKLLAEVSLEEFDNVIDLNLRGPFVALQVEISAMLRSGAGSIINVASTAGLRAVPRLVAYTSTKHALVGLTKVAALDYAVQDAWLRLAGTGDDEIENLDGWLTTVTGRICLNMLRTRKARREEPLGPHVPEPIVSSVEGADPEHEALLGDSVGLALQVVLETLTPGERLAYVLHDMFGVAFEEIAPLVERKPAAARKLARRARARVDAAPIAPDVELGQQREVVDAFFAAARDGRFEDLVAVIDPEIVLRSDGGVLRPAATAHVEGAEAVASRAMTFASLAPWVRPALVNGVAGAVVAPPGELFSVMAFTVRGGRIAAIDVLSDPDRLAGLNIARLGPQAGRLGASRRAQG